MPSDVGLPVSRSVLSTTSAQGATRLGEHFVGRDSVSDGQRPILILAASCDRVNRYRNLGACFRAQGATRGKAPPGVWNYLEGVAQCATTRYAEATPVGPSGVKSDRGRDTTTQVEDLADLRTSLPEFLRG